MPTPTSPQEPRKIALIIWGAMVGVLLLSFAVASVLGDGRPPVEPGLGRMLALIATIQAAISVVASRHLPGYLKPRGSVTPDQHALTRHIVAAGVCEASALFSVMAWFLTGNTWLLAPLAVAQVGLATCYPGIERWVTLGGSPR
jgi:hypothetical protein